MPGLFRFKPTTICFPGRGFALLCRHSAVLVCHSPLSQIRMEYWHPTANPVKRLYSSSTSMCTHGGDGV